MPATSSSLLHSLISHNWGRSTISELIQWSQSGVDVINEPNIQEPFLTDLAQQLTCFKHGFVARDHVYVNLYLNTAIIIRGSSSGYRVVGRIAYAHYSERWERPINSLVWDAYGCHYLYGTSVLVSNRESGEFPSSKRRLTNDDAFLILKPKGDGCKLVDIVFNVIRAAIIMFVLPNNQTIRDIATPMLSELDGLGAFEDIRRFTTSIERQPESGNTGFQAETENSEVSKRVQGRKRERRKGKEKFELNRGNSVRSMSTLRQLSACKRNVSR